MKVSALLLDILRVVFLMGIRGKKRMMSRMKRKVYLSIPSDKGHGEKNNKRVTMKKAF